MSDYHCPIHEEDLQSCLRELHRRKIPWEGQNGECWTHTLKGYIIYLRRNRVEYGHGEDQEVFRQFREHVESHLDLIETHVSTRWIVSICDTYVDFAKPPVQQEAMLISLLANWEKLSWTLRLVKGLGRQARRRVTRAWDGMVTLEVNGHADMHRHLFRRLEECITEPTLRRLSKVVVRKMLKANWSTLTLLNEITLRGRRRSQDLKREVARNFRC